MDFDVSLAVFKEQVRCHPLRISMNHDFTIVRCKVRLWETKRRWDQMLKEIKEWDRKRSLMKKGVHLIMNRN